MRYKERIKFLEFITKYPCSITILKEVRIIFI